MCINSSIDSHTRGRFASTVLWILRFSMLDSFTNSWSVHTVLQILTFGIGSYSSRWCLGVVGVLMCMHSSTDSDIRPAQANFISQAHITSQAYTLARLTRPWFLICLSMTSQADFISQANITSQAGTRARLTRPWFFYLLLHDFTS